MAVLESTGFVAALLGPQSFDDIFLDGCIEVRTGPQPVNADAATSGTLLGRITRNGGGWAAGSPTNGLRFLRDGRFVFKDPTHIWRYSGIANGTAGWFRLLPNAADAGGVSLTAPRIDGEIGVNGEVGDFQMFFIDLNVVIASSFAVENWFYAKPPL